jgi:hypothetical protein
MPSNLLANVTLQQLKQAVVIREKIEDLEKELSGIIGGGLPGVKKAGPARRRMLSASARAKISAAMKTRWAKKKRNQRKSSLATGKTKKPRGQLKDRIIQALEAAGKPGMKVKDLASKLGTSYGNVNVWLSTTAKGVKEIKKIAPGRFTWAP